MAEYPYPWLIQKNRFHKEYRKIKMNTFVLKNNSVWSWSPQNKLQFYWKVPWLIRTMQSVIMKNAAKSAAAWCIIRPHFTMIGCIYSWYFYIMVKIFYLVLSYDPNNHLHNYHLATFSNLVGFWTLKFDIVFGRMFRRLMFQFRLSNFSNWKNWGESIGRKNTDTVPQKTIRC